ncbi:MAG: hypothetical protein ABI051_06195 [Vicinamibacterales bacterium]
MTEGHLGRLLAASLHQAIMDELPNRLEFYENWLHGEGLRDGTIGMAPMSAVVGFLRTEGEAYDRVMARAGGLAAEWAIASMSTVEVRAIGWLPRPLRLKAGLRMADSVARSAMPQSPLVRKVRGARGRVQITSSLFCAARGEHAAPLCGFYRSLIDRTLQLCDIEATTRVESCRAVDGSPCVVGVQLMDSQPTPAIAP